MTIAPLLSHPMRFGRLYFALIATAISTGFSLPQANANDEPALWEALKSGQHFALMRHAIAPGTGDPVNFKLRDCSTQRKLSQQGRDQAQRIGERFRANGIDSALIYSSQWCRCLETAELLSLGPVREMPSLNSFFRRYENREEQTSELERWLAQQDCSEATVLVTHQVNITALTQFYPSSGEIVIVHRTDEGELEVLGSIETD